MANTLATPHWDEIRRLAEQGVPVQELATRYGVAEKTIWNRSASEDWLTPSRLKAKIFQSRRNQQGLVGRESPFGGAELSKKGESLLVETWETRAESLRNLSYDVAVEAIKSAKGQIVVESASDLKAAVHVARQATGVLDADTPAVQVSLFGSGPDLGPRIMDIQETSGEPLQLDTEPDGFWE